MKRKSCYETMSKGLLKKLGIKCRVEQQKRGHTRLWFSVPDGERFMVLPNTPSNTDRGLKNHIAHLKRMVREFYPELENV